MKTFLVALIFSQSAFSIAYSSDTSCSPKESIATEYVQWKKSYQKLMNTFDGLSASERFDSSKDAIKVVLDKMLAFSESTAVPLPKATFSHAKGLLTEVEAGRIARLTAIPILKSSLKTLEVTMDEMIAKAQWKNPSCKFAAIDREFSKSVSRN